MKLKKIFFEWKIAFMFSKKNFFTQISSSKLMNYCSKVMQNETRFMTKSIDITIDLKWLISLRNTLKHVMHLKERKFIEMTNTNYWNLYRSQNVTFKTFQWTLSFHCSFANDTTNLTNTSWSLWINYSRKDVS